MTLPLSLALLGCADDRATPEAGDALEAAFALPARPSCTADGWCWVDPPLQGNDLNGLFAGAAGDLWAAGDADTTIHAEPPAVDVHLDGTGWATWNAVWAAASDDAWLVGSDGRIAHDDGTGPVEVPSGVTEELLDVHGSAADDVWAVGRRSTLLHYDGVSWAPVAGPAADLRAVVAIDRDDVWVSSFSGSFYHWDGTSWTRRYLEDGRAVEISDLWAAGPDEVYAVASGLYAWDPAQAVFVAVDCGVDADKLRGVGGSGAEVFAVGREGFGVRFDGSTCTSTPLADGDWSDVEVSPTLGPWAVGTNGAIARWSGTDWTLVVGNPGNGSAPMFYDIHGDDQAVWTVGWSVLRSDVATEAEREWPVPQIQAEEVWTWMDEAWVSERAFAGDPLLGHFDGRRWTQVTDCPVPTYHLWGADGEVWVLWGSLYVRRASGAWVEIPTPSGGAVVRGTATDDLWVGGSSSGNDASIDHWDGTRWSSWSFPRAAGGDTAIVSLLEVSLDEVWAGDDHGRVFHGDHGVWTELPEISGTFWITDLTIAADGSLVVTENALTGRVHRWSGTAWIEEDVGAQELFGLWTTRWGDTFAVGRGGAILERR